MSTPPIGHVLTDSSAEAHPVHGPFVPNYFEFWQSVSEEISFGKPHPSGCHVFGLFLVKGHRVNIHNVRLAVA